MIPMEDSLARLVRDGTVAHEEALRRAEDPEEIEKLFRWRRVRRGSVVYDGGASNSRPGRAPYR
jgi:hypothetical protein